MKKELKLSTEAIFSLQDIHPKGLLLQFDTFQLWNNHESSLTQIAFHLFGLAGKTGPRRARTFFPPQLPNSRALAHRSERTERLWSMSRNILTRTSPENSECVPFKNWLVGRAIMTGQMESDLRWTVTSSFTNVIMHWGIYGAYVGICLLNKP